MTTIKAHEITPGMVIEWTDRDMFKRTTVREYDSSMLILRSVQGVVNFLPPDTDVEVISAPPVIPTEPKALGARVKAGDRLFLLAYDDGCGWVDVTRGTDGGSYTWENVKKFGPVTVIDGDPSWEVETNEDTPEQWDDIEEALNHCDKVKDRDGDTWCYVDGALYFTFDGGSTSWAIDVDDANRHGPFRRV